MFKPWTKDEIRQLLADNYATCREVADADFGFTMYQVMGIKGNMVKLTKTNAETPAKTRFLASSPVPSNQTQPPG